MYKIQTNSNKYFGRLDWNINSKSTLTLRGIFTHGRGNNLERTSNNFQFGNFDFTQHSKNSNVVAELKTKFNSTLNNQLVVSYINVHDYRNFPGTVAPMIDINGGQIWAGTWREASLFNMTQKTIEFTDNVTLNKGINKFTFGTHNEFYNVTYGFVNSWNGRWEYSSLSSFYANQPSRIRSGFSLDPGKSNRDDLYNNPPGQFNINLTSAYAQDEISISKKFKLSPGVRFDYSFVKNQPSNDPAVNTTPEYTSQNPTYTHTPWNQFTNKWFNNVNISPRLGFSYDVNGNQSFVIRGGSGVFIGRIPFAWFGNAFTLDGSAIGNVDYKPGGKTVGLAINPTTLRDTVTKYGGPSASATHEVDIIDNNFKLPTIWRSNIATDIKFGRGYKLTLDAMYTKTIYDVLFQQINIKDSAVYYSTGPTQSPIYVGGKANNAFSNAYLLTNTKQGYRYNLTAQISKNTNNIKVGDHSLNIGWTAAYTYGVSKDVSNGIRNSFSSNYEQNPEIVPSSPTLTYSNFDLRNRIVGTASFGFNWNEYNTTSLAFFYSGQSGSPYTFIYTSSPNPFGNASSSNLAYIPKQGEQMNFADIKDATGNVTYSGVQQQADFNSYVDKDKYLSKRRGQYTARNDERTPWNHELDMKLMHEFKFKGNDKQQSIQLSFDVFNVLNLISNSWGHISFVTNVNNYNVNLLAFANDAAGHKPGAPSSGYIPTFNYIRPASTGHYYTTDPINSRWQSQLGVKYNF